MDYIATPGAPKAIGPYSQAILANGVLYTSGQIALHPETGEIVPGDFAAQANRGFDNHAAVLKEAGSGFDRVMKATVYVTDLANFATLNTIYVERFGNHRPARTTVQVPALPKGSLLEIDLVALT